MSDRDVIITSAVNIKRNISGMPFEAKLNEESRRDVVAALCGLTADRDMEPDNQDFPSAEMMIDRKTLWENADINTDVSFTDEEGVRLIMDADDHANLRAIRFGKDIEGAYEECRAAEEQLSAGVDFAFDSNFGYLTSRLRDTGNGMRTVILVHLPALTELEKIEETKKQLLTEGFDLIKLIEHDDSACAFYCLVSRINMGKSCEEVIELTRDEMKALESAERTAREQLVYDDPDDFADKVLRSLGVLTNARLLDYEEFIELYSDIRMGLTGGLLNGNRDALDSFALSVSPEGIYQKYGNVDDRDELLLRAEKVRAQIKGSITCNELE